MISVERIIRSRFINEPTLPEVPLSDTAKFLWAAEFARLTAFSFLIARQLDADTANQIMLLPDFMHGRIHDFFGGFVASSISRILGRRALSMACGFSLNAISETASLTGLPFFGTYDSGDFIAFGTGALTWGTVDYLRARGLERFKKYLNRSG